MRISDWSSDVCSSDLDTAMEEQDNTAEIIRDLAAIKVGEFGGVPYAIVPRTHELKLLEQLAPPKTFVARGKVQAHDVKGFVDYINKFKLDTTRRSEEHTSELQSLMRISYAVFCLQKKKKSNH